MASATTGIDTTTSRAPKAGLLRAVLRHTSGKVGVGIVLGAVLLAVAGDVIAPNSPLEQDLSNAFQEPILFGGTSEHLLGTDHLGRDVLSRVIGGTRISIAVGLIAATASALIGTILGLLAGWRGGATASIVLRAADIQFALPFLVVCLALVSIYGPGITKVILLLSVWGWASYARTISTSVASVKQLDYVHAARLSGAGSMRLVRRHVLPNVRGPIIVLWSAAAGGLILAESALSLLGLGVQAPEFSWGSMLAEGKTYLRMAPWLTVVPAAALVIVIIGFNLVGDALRDAVNPRLNDGDAAPNLS